MCSVSTFRSTFRFGGSEVDRFARGVPGCARLSFSLHLREWRNGRRASFRCWCPKGRGGSSPPSRTTDRAQARFDQVSDGDPEKGSPAPIRGSHHDHDVESVATDSSGTDHSVPATVPRTASVHHSRRVAEEGSPAPIQGARHEWYAESVGTGSSGTDHSVPATAPRTASVHHSRRLAANLGSLNDRNNETRRLARTPLRTVSAAPPRVALEFPVCPETRRLDADGRIKVASNTPQAIRLSDLLGWQSGTLDLVCVDGWTVLTQPDHLAGVKSSRNGVHARFSINSSGIERICLKVAHVRSLGVGEFRTVLVAPVPAWSALVLVNPVTCPAGAPPHVAALIDPDANTQSNSEMPRPQLIVIDRTTQ